MLPSRRGRFGQTNYAGAALKGVNGEQRIKSHREPMGRRGGLKVGGYREAGPRPSGGRIWPEMYRGDLAFTIVLDRKEKDKINWIRVRALG